MKNIQVNKDGNTAIAKIVRYIKFDGLKYVIYSLNEIDEEEYEKLYVNKIEDNNIIETEEWVKFKKAIPMIVKEIKAEAIEGFEDLSINDINDIDTTNYKAFKLKKEIVFSIIKEEDIIEEPTFPDVEEPIFPEVEESIFPTVDDEPVKEDKEDFEFSEVHPVSNLEEEEIKEHDHSNVEDILGTLDEDIDDITSDEIEYNITSDFTETTIKKEEKTDDEVEKLKQELKEKNLLISELEYKLNKIKDMLN